MSSKPPDGKKYNALENVLQDINKKYIALSDESVKKNNAILHEILEKILKQMKDGDPMFNDIFGKLHYGGSFYDGLKIMYPDEYDIHILLKLPPKVPTEIIVSNVPGFVHIRMKNITENLSGNLENFAKLVNKNRYMEAARLRQWMEKLFQKSLNSLTPRGSKYLIPTSYGNCEIYIRKTGPAFTLHVKNDQLDMDVDLVPCFIFDTSQWPDKDFRPNPFPTTKPNFYVVPKQPKGVNGPVEHYWLVNLQEQERELIKGTSVLKPAIKLLKKMKDHLNHKTIASYYIKSVGLWLMEEKKTDPTFWCNSLSYVFMTLLKKYHSYLEKKYIPYYWNQYYNLVKNVDPITLENIKNKIGKIIDDVEKNMFQDPYVIAKYLITQEEILELRACRLNLNQ